MESGGEKPKRTTRNRSNRSNKRLLIGEIGTAFALLVAIASCIQSRRAADAAIQQAESAKEQAAFAKAQVRPQFLMRLSSPLSERPIDRELNLEIIAEAGAARGLQVMARYDLAVIYCASNDQKQSFRMYSGPLDFFKTIYVTGRSTEMVAYAPIDKNTLAKQAELSAWNTSLRSQPDRYKFFATAIRPAILLNFVFRDIFEHRRESWVFTEFVDDELRRIATREITTAESLSIQDAIRRHNLAGETYSVAHENCGRD